MRRPFSSLSLGPFLHASSSLKFNMAKSSAASDSLPLLTNSERAARLRASAARLQQRADDISTVVASLVADDPSVASGSGSAAAVEQGEGDPVPAASKAYYVVWGGNAANVGLVGVHHCSWNVFLAKLPGGNLFGSGIRDGKRFDSKEEAVKHFKSKRKNSDEETLIHV